MDHLTQELEATRASINQFRGELKRLDVVEAQTNHLRRLTWAVIGVIVALVVFAAASLVYALNQDWERDRDLDRQSLAACQRYVQGRIDGRDELRTTLAHLGEELEADAVRIERFLNENDLRIETTNPLPDCGDPDE